MQNPASYANSWLVVQTHPHKEAFAVLNLERQNFTTYAPVIHKRVRHARRTEDVLRPLFPGYVFVKPGQLSTALRPLQGTFGVRCIIGGDRPSLLSGDFIASLRAREIDGVIVRPDSPYRAGQPVRMVGGAFDGLVATILGLDDNGRITVLMELLNQAVKVHTSLHGVRQL